MDMGRTIDRTIDAGLILLVVFTPLAFGSVHVWAYSFMELVVFSLMILWGLKLFITSVSIDRVLMPVYISLLVFISMVFLQMIPMPPEAIRLLSPKAYELYGLAIPGYEDGDILRSLSIYPHVTKVKLVQFISYAFVFFLITQEVREKRRIERIIIAIVLVGAFEALYGLYGYFSKHYYIFGFKRIYYMGAAAGTYVNRSHFAGYMGMVAPLCMGYLLSKALKSVHGGLGLKDRVIGFLNTARASKTSALLVVVVTMTLSIVFSLSRMGVFSFIAAVLFMGFISILNKQKKLAGVFFAIVSLGIIVSVWYGIEPLEKRYSHLAESYSGGRAVIWEGTVNVAKDYPLTGTGLGTYGAIFQRYRPEQVLSIRFEHAHNDYLEIISEAGISGALPLAFGIVYFSVLVLKRWAKSRDSFSKGISLGGIGSMVYIALHSLTDFNMQIPANALAFFIITALTYRSVTLGGNDI
jgi:O-antigen ligase